MHASESNKVLDDDKAPLVLCQRIPRALQKEGQFRIAHESCLKSDKERVILHLAEIEILELGSVVRSEVGVLLAVGRVAENCFVYGTRIGVDEVNLLVHC